MAELSCSEWLDLILYDFDNRKRQPLNVDNCAMVSTVEWNTRRNDR